MSETSFEPRHKPIAIVPRTRRRSTLGIITEDEGLHTIKHPENGGITTIPGRGDAAPDSKPRTRKTSREIRWQSIRQRTRKKRESTEFHMKNVHRIAKQHQGQQRQSLLASRSRSLTFPVAEERTANRKRRKVSCGDNATESFNVHDFPVLKPRTEQKERTVSYQDTCL